MSHRSTSLIRLDDAETRETLGLQPRPRDLYPLAEVRQALDDAVEKIQERSPDVPLRGGERKLIDVATRVQTAERGFAQQQPVLRIDSLEVLDLFGLPRREGFLYSVAEIRPQSDKFHKEADRVREKKEREGADKLSVYERKLLELDRRVRVFTAI